MLGELADRMADRVADRMAGKSPEEIDAERRAKEEKAREEKAEARMRREEERAKKKSEKQSDGRTTRWDYFKHGIHGGMLVVTLNMDGENYRSNESLVNWSKKQAIALGYRPAVGYMDGWEALFLPVYVKFNGFRIADAGDNRETAGTMYDYMASNAQADFLKGIHNTRSLNGLDMKRIGMMAIVVLGVILGLALMG